MFPLAGSKPWHTLHQAIKGDDVFVTSVFVISDDINYLLNVTCLNVHRELRMYNSYIEPYLSGQEDEHHDFILNVV